jgi:hypothetical protein
MDSTRPKGISRGRFLVGAAGAAGVAAAGALGGAQLLTGQGGPPLSADDPLALALALERLQAAFYAEAVDGGALSGELLDFAATTRGHEEEHASALAPLVGGGGAQAEYDFGSSVTDPDAFATAAATLEDLAVSAYNGMIPLLDERGLAAAGRIVSVDARHAAWIRAIAGSDPAEDATDAPLTPEQVVARVEDLGFIAAPP